MGDPVDDEQRDPDVTITFELNRPIELNRRAVIDGKLVIALGPAQATPNGAGHP